MGYCMVSDVESYYTNKKFKSDGYVTIDKVQDMIDSYTETVDALLSARYVLPLTAASDLKILKMIVVKFVVGDVDDIFREKTEDGRFNRQRNTTKDAQNYLDLIMAGQLLLKASQTSSTIKFNNIGSNGHKVHKRFKDSNIEPNPMASPRPLPGHPLSPEG